MRRFLKTAAPLIVVALAGVAVVAGSSGPEPCPAGEICPPPPDCVKPGEARRLADEATRGPRPGLAPFGFNDGAALAGQASPELIAALHRELGATLIRFALDWRRVEGSRGSYNFGAEDEIYCAALERGVAPVIQIAGAPKWAAAPVGECANCLRPPRPEHLDALGELARVVAERYPGAAAIEAWNEPNLPLFWESPDPQRYVEVLRAIREGVNAAGADTVLLGGSLANAPDRPQAIQRLRDFVRRIYEHGAGSLMDAISIHPYPGAPIGHPRQRFDPMLKTVRAAAADAGHGEMPIWITELGLRTAGGADHSDVAPAEPDAVFSVDEQAETLTRLYRRASAAEKVEAVIFHTLLEPDGRVASRGGYGWLAPAGGGIQAKPVWCAMKSISRPAAGCPRSFEAAPEDDRLR